MIAAREHALIIAQILLLKHMENVSKTTLTATANAMNG